MVLTAVCQTGLALKHAAADCCNDRELVLFAVKITPERLPCFTLIISLSPSRTYLAASCRVYALPMPDIFVPCYNRCGPRAPRCSSRAGSCRGTRPWSSPPWSRFKKISVCRLSVNKSRHTLATSTGTPHGGLWVDAGIRRSGSFSLRGLWISFQWIAHLLLLLASPPRTATRWRGRAQSSRPTAPSCSPPSYRIGTP